MSLLRLRGLRVLLRPIEAGDRGQLRAILDEPAVARWFGPGGADASVDELYRHEPGSSFVIEVDAATVGWIGYAEELDPDYRHAGIDLFLATAHHGRGLGPEALRLLVEHLVHDQGHHRITIDPAAANDRAIRAYEKVGFRPVGILREYERGADGTWHDGLLMELLRGELVENRPGAGSGTLR
jgi:aminoglycoside 6'-N-acetyltransferase